MLGIVLKLFVIAVALCLTAFAAANAFRSARRLDQRVKEFKAEQEELKRQGKITDPFAALAELYAEETSQPVGPARGSREARQAQRYAREVAKKRQD